VDRDEVAGARVVEEAQAVLPAADGLRSRSAETELAIGPLERDCVDEEVGADAVADGPPPDAAAVDRPQDVVRRPATEQSGHREDVQDVEGMDGVGAVGRLGREPAPGRRSDSRPESLLDGASNAVMAPSSRSPPSQ
jgi:hypothetical protein